LSACNALSAAFRLLALRDRSEKDLSVRLQRKGFGAEEISATLERCRELGYVDDERFARQRAKILLAEGRAVGYRLLAELKQQGIAEELARRALAEAEQEIDLDQVLEALLRRRFDDFCFAAADDRQRRRVINYFQRRGFSPARVLQFLQEER
jgi:regulatory protein